MPGHQLIIVSRRVGRWLGPANRLDFGAGQFLDRKRLPIATLEAFEFHDRQEHQPSPAVAGDGKRRPERFVLKVAEVALELAGSDCLHLGPIRMTCL